jgi:kynurenine formamidase
MIPVWAVGMVYKISRLDKFGNEVKIYIGKKLLQSNRKGKISKREIAATGTRKRVKRVVKDSGWMKYNSSCPELVREIKEDPGQFSKEIVEWCWSKKQLSYVEMEWQVKEDVLRRDTYNGNVLSRWFRKDLIRPEKKEVL